jgi:hypothetical protein
VPDLRRLARAVLLSVIAGLCVPAALAQNASLRGFVRDASNGEALEGAAVVLRDASGGLSGAATDRDGYFVVPRVAPGRYGIRVSYLGFRMLRDTLVLRPGEDAARVFRLQPSDVEGEEVTVESARDDVSDLGLAGLDVIRPADIERLPTPGVSADLVSYVTAQPGVVAQGDRGGQLFVRGGTPSQNLVLIDGIPILQPFHVIGFYSAFPADILASADLYAGGFGARYGGRISSVLDVKARTGNNRNFTGSVSAGPFLVTALAEGPIVRGRSAFLLSDRESVIEQVAPRLLARDLPYRFYDRFGKLSWDVSTRTSAALTLMQTYDRGKLSDLQSGRVATDTTNDAVIWKNAAYGLRLLHLPAGVPFIGEMTATFTRHENLFGTAGSPERTSSVQFLNFNFSLQYLVRGQELEAGASIRNGRLAYRLGGIFEGTRDGTEYLTEGTVYLDAPLSLSNAFAVRPGIRLSSFRGKGTVEPRVRAFFRPGGTQARHQITAAWGIYRQDLEGIADRRDAGDVFTAWVASGLDGEVPRAVHTILGYGFRASRRFSLELEGFHKRLDNLLVPVFSSVPQFTTRLQPASGTVTGGDAKVKGEAGPVFGSLAYGYSRTRYQALDPRIQYWYGTSSFEYAPPHDRQHQFTATAGATLAGFELSAQWQFGSGLPFTRSAGFDVYVHLDSTVNVMNEPGTPRVLYGQPYDARLPTYHRLDASLQRKFRVGTRARATLQVGLTNAYDRRNLFYLDLFTLRRIDQLPLIPSAGFKLELL